MYVRAPNRISEEPVPQCYLIPNIPKQLSVSDSGLLICKYMDCFARGSDMSSLQFSPEDIEDFRFQIVYELVREGRACQM